MDNTTSKLEQTGFFSVALGITSSLLFVFNFDARLLDWIDPCGNIIGWIIRIALIVGGAILFNSSNRKENEELY